MKISDILNETAAPMYSVYKVYSPNTDVVYYSYTKNPDIKRGFLSHADESNPDRGDVKMINRAGGAENLRFELVDVFDNEVEAHAERNDLRARDSQSITGPSPYPPGAHQRAVAMFPDRARQWNISDINTVTAEVAYKDDKYKDQRVFDYPDIKRIASQSPTARASVVADLSKMMYPDFVKKYFPERA